jgi:hypothetical protein
LVAQEGLPAALSAAISSDSNLQQARIRKRLVTRITAGVHPAHKELLKPRDDKEAQH